MNLITKVLVIAVVVIILLFILGTSLESAPKHVSSAEAESNITNYINTAYPGSVVNITSINSSGTNSWNILASVTTNSTSPCPSYFILSFDYPQYQFVSRLEDNYTAYSKPGGLSNCKIYGVQPNAQYQIPSSPVAIAWTYVSMINRSNAFIDRYGYANVSVHANYFSSLSINGMNYTGVYLVNYTSPMSNHTVSIILQQRNASVSYVWNTTT